MDIEEFKRFINEVRNGAYMKNISIGHFTDLVNEAIEELEAEIKELREAQEWISVDDKWPKKGGFYMFFVRDEVRMIYFFPNFKTSGFDYKFNKATHWQPLPKPPKEQE